MTRYRYDYPSTWLNEYIDRYADDPLMPRAIIVDLMSKLSEDEIQDLFQHAMDADGYFDDLDKPTDAEESS